ncbi:MAG: phosphatase PAP2 family protein, partial [Bacteroidales bacterium]|nr:phosphatase PAP2 family protein [Bacteroidales bacterium]
TSEQLYMTKRFIILILLLVPAQLYSQNIDIRLLRNINSHETLSSDRFFQFVSNSESYMIVGIPAGMGIGGLIKHDDQLFRNACVTIVTIGVNFSITTALKYSINRERPYITYTDITKKSTGGSPSFPSGHTSSAFSIATSLSLTYPKWYIVIPTYTWADTVGYSRMHLGVHYPSDVVAGALIGAGTAWLTFYVNKKLISNTKNRH